MHGRGRQHASDGDAAIGAVDVQLVADPGLRMSLGIPRLSTNRPPYAPRETDAESTLKNKESG
jgi:hypothetical protein